MTIINSDRMGNFLKAESDGAEVKPIAVSMKNMEVKGDIKHMDYQRIMTLSLENATLNGAVVSGTMEEWNRLWTAYDKEECNWLVDESYNTRYGVKMTLKNGATWNVSGLSTLSGLTVENGGKINGTVQIDGKTVTPAAGKTYTGNIVVQPMQKEGKMIMKTGFRKTRLVLYALILLILQFTACDRAPSVVSKSVDAGATWEVAETTRLDELTIAEGAAVNAPEGKSVTLTVGGVETGIAAGSYAGNVVLTVTEECPIKFQETTIHPFRQALYLGENGVVDAKSVLAAAGTYTVSGETLTGAGIVSRGGNFNGIYANGGTHIIKDATIDLTGNGGNDFAGYGATVMSDGPGTTLVVDSSKITTRGAIRTAFVAQNTSNLDCQEFHRLYKRRQASRHVCYQCHSRPDDGCALDAGNNRQLPGHQPSGEQHDGHLHQFRHICRGLGCSFRG